MQLPRPGETFEQRYRIDEALGEGGFAIVYRATDESHRTVALKLLKPEDGAYSLEVQSRFTREVRMLASLQDPHTVRLFNFGRGEQSGLLFLVFEHIEGHDLSEVLRERGRLPPDVALKILRQLIYSLREAHAAGLLHRDLKPANVRVYEYLGDPWQVKLLDFGIARPMAGGEPAITRAGELLGTPRYMSPEQLTERDLTPASDIYSLGLVTMEMLVGGGALGGNSWGDQVERMRSGHVFGIPSLDLDGGLTTVIQRMTAREPEQRYQSVDEVLSALDRIERAGPHTSSREPAVAAASVSRQLPREPTTDVGRSWRHVAATVAAGILIAGGLLALHQRSKPPSPPDASATRGAPSSGSRDVPFVRSKKPTPLAERSAEEPPLDLGHDDGAEPSDAAIAPTDGCGLEPPVSGLLLMSEPDLLDVREWLVYVPTSYDSDTPTPIVVLFHDDLRRPRGMLEHTAFDKAADEHGFLILLPASPTAPPWRSRDTVTHVRGLIDDTARQLCVDTQRIFLVGHGSGGNAAEWLSCESWAAGVVTTSYRANEHDIGECQPPHRVPAFQLHAMDSPRMPAEGGRSCGNLEGLKESLAAFEERYRDRNDCRGNERRYSREVDGECFTWSCERPYVSCRIAGGHGWPNAAKLFPQDRLRPCDPVASAFPATKVIGRWLGQTMADR